MDKNKDIFAPPLPEELSSARAVENAPTNDLFAAPSPEELGQQPKQQEVGSIEAALRGLGQGASLGFADEISAAVRAPFSEKTYEELRDQARAADTAAKEQHPYLYGGGELGGAIGTAFIPGLNLAKLPSVGGRVAAAAGIGAAAGLGGSDADLLKGEIGQAAKDTATGGAIGGVFGAAAEALSPAMRYVSKKASERAVASALDTIHPRMAELKKFYGSDKLQQIGRELIDQNIIKPFDTADDVYRKLVDRTQEIGESIAVKVDDMAQSPLLQSRNFANEMKSEIASDLGQSPNAPAALEKISKYLDETVAKTGTPGEPVITRHMEFVPNKPKAPEFELSKVPGTPKQVGIDPLTGEPLFSPTEVAQAGFAAPEAPGFSKQLVEKRIQSSPTMSALDAWNLQKDIGSAVNYGKKINDLPESQQALETIRKRLSDTIKAADPTGEVAALQNQYHLLESAEGMAKNEAARMQANQSAGLGEGVYGALGAAAGGIPGAIIGAGGKYLWRTRGASTVAYGMDKLSKMLSAAPEAFGSYAPILKQAAQKGGSQLAVTHYLLSQRDPKYREQLDKTLNSK